MEEVIKITWYGRCCFIAELNGVRVLFDPYDRFCNVDMGMVDAQVLLSSSSWHDHGHIGAAPGAWIFSYSGNYTHLGLNISGIEVQEGRGSPSVVFNVRFKSVSITNFADMGVYAEGSFNKEQKEVLGSTNIAFIRSGHEKVLDFCDPRIIIPEHYFPEDFIHNQVPEDLREDFLQPNKNVDEMIKLLDYPVELIDDFSYVFNIGNLSDNKFFRFMKLHPQVRYLSEPKFVKHW
ncbi:MBL fold metallo-hydrolase [Candidatus Woesebacteria bacterium]|nr:MBL fold metallo-hydrolase [Candidatus Woesebacteria bacterium]